MQDDDNFNDDANEEFDVDEDDDAFPDDDREIELEMETTSMMTRMKSSMRKKKTHSLTMIWKSSSRWRLHCPKYLAMKCSAAFWWTHGPS